MASPSPAGNDTEVRYAVQRQSQWPVHAPFLPLRLRMLDEIHPRCSTIGVTAVRPPQALGWRLRKGPLDQLVMP
jgi:hypothetical protein